MKLKKGIPVIDQGDRLGFWGGKFGGNFVPETLKKPIEDLEIQFNKLKNEDTFMLTYGDGVSNIDISKLLQFHKSHGKIATVTAVRPPVRFGELIIDDNDKVEEFAEKPQAGKGWINGGFFVFNKEIFNYIEDDSIMLEREPLEKLSKTGELMAYKHHDFWQCMDTIREKEILEKLWSSNNAIWLK